MGRAAFVPATDYQSITAKSVVVKRDRRRSARVKREERLRDKPFVVWDGEGAKNPKHVAQSFVLFGSYNGADHDYITGPSLTTAKCLDQIIKVGQANPGAWHVSFAFGYDVNMILHNLTVRQFKYLRKHRVMMIGKDYRVEHRPGKYFQVTRYHDDTHKTTVTIYDVFGFYQSSFVRALKDNIPDHSLMVNLDVIEAGKAKRNEFTYKNIAYITKYWKVEQTLFHALVNRLREMVYDAGLFISRWHGPGELASYLYRIHGIKGHKCETDNHIYEFARYAYCGGRFERFRIGRFTRVYGLDINSAYPDAISRLPSLQNGVWNHRDRIRWVGEIREFGIYRVRLNVKEWQKPGPLFRRDWKGNITFPWKLEGWYWGPEVLMMLKHYPHLITAVQEGWIYENDGTRPFAFVRDLYTQRQAWKRANNGAQLALKLALNSMYGKMAQRVGWERTGKAPAWHQLEWAGFVTSYTRAKLFDLMCRIPFDDLIAVETDGVYTTALPSSLGITDSDALGGWEVTYYDEIIYLQSGVYSKRRGDKWEMKYRGLDRDTVSPQKMADHCKALIGWSKEHAGIVLYEVYAGDGVLQKQVTTKMRKSSEIWPVLKGETTRFIGYENALFREDQNRGPFRVHHCKWETTPVEIDCSTGSKRAHKISQCRACDANANAYEMPHDTVIRNNFIKRNTDGPPTHDITSHPHDIPWLDDDDPDAWQYEWRLYEQEQEGLIKQ